MRGTAGIALRKEQGMQSDSSVVVRVAKENREAFRPDFLAWLIANVHVFAEFERQARAA